MRVYRRCTAWDREVRRLTETVWWLVEAGWGFLAAVFELMEARWGYWMLDEG